MITPNATQILKNMLLCAAEIPPGPTARSLITEHIDGVCVQCVGSMTYRRTPNGLRPVARLRWFVECRLSNKADVFDRFGRTRADDNAVCAGHSMAVARLTPAG